MLYNIHKFLASILGDTGAPLAYVIRVEIIVPLEATDTADAHLMVDQELTYCAQHSGTSFRNDKRNVLDYMENIYNAPGCWVYIKPAQ
jgi:hypothetical protein